MRHFSSKAKRFVVQNQVKVQSDSIFFTPRVLFYEYLRTERVETDLRSAESWLTLESLIKNTDLDQYIFLESVVFVFNILSFLLLINRLLYKVVAEVK